MTTDRHYPTSAKEAFPKDSLERISKAIAEIEEATNAEIRLSIRDLREAGEADLSVREMALKEFATLRMHETENHVGILLLILFDERKFYILGDEGVHSRVNPETWEDVAQTIREHFKQGSYERGVIAALRGVQGHMTGVLPKGSSHTNELSDEVVIR